MGYGWEVEINKMKKGIAITSVIIAVGGSLTTFFIGWNAWLSLTTIDNKSQIAATSATMADIQRTVHEIAQHDNVQVSDGTSQ